MCGRYTLGAESDALVETFDVPPLRFPWSPRYNIAPGQDAPVIAQDRRGRRMGLLTWGLIPGGFDLRPSGIVNARSETVAEKPAFREAFERRRCLVPADGFYEWQRDAAGKTPYWIHPRGGGLLTFAGLWERWSRQGVPPLHTFVILTTAANEDVAPIHERMPVVLSGADRATWLASSSRLRDLVALLRAPPAGALDRRPVSSRVNRPTEDEAALIEPHPA